MNKICVYVLGFLVSTSVTAIAGFDYSQCTDLDEQRAHVGRKTLALKVYSRQLEGIIGQAVGMSGKLPSHMEPLLHLKERLNKKLDVKQKLLQTLSEKKEEQPTSCSVDSSKVRTVEGMKDEGQFWITLAQTLNTAGFKHSDDKLFGSWDLFQGYMDAHPTLKASIAAQNKGAMDPLSYAKLVSNQLLTYENVLTYVQEKAMRTTKRALGLPVRQLDEPYQDAPSSQQSTFQARGIATEAPPQQASVVSPSVLALSKPTTLQGANDRLLREIILHYKELAESLPLEHRELGGQDLKLMHALAIRCNSTIEQVAKMIHVLNNEIRLSPDLKAVQKYIESFFQNPVENKKMYEEVALLENINFKARVYLDRYDPQQYTTCSRDRFQFTNMHMRWFEDPARAPLKLKWKELAGIHANNTPNHYYFNDCSVFFNVGFDLIGTPFKGFVILEKPIDFQYLMESCLK